MDRENPLVLQDLELIRYLELICSGSYCAAICVNVEVDCLGGF